jgi:hypothetical protein
VVSTEGVTSSNEGGCETGVGAFVASVVTPLTDISFSACGVPILAFLGPFLIPASERGWVFLLPGGLPLRLGGSGDLPSASLLVDTAALSSRSWRILF